MDFDHRTFKEQCRKIQKINGWFSHHAHAFWDLLLGWQKSHVPPGHLVEIGVWKGKSASVLAFHKRDEEELHLIDPVIKPEKVAKSILKVGGRVPPNIHFHKRSSFKIDDDAGVRPLTGGVRFCHIDGEHSGHMVYSDMAAAQKLLAEQGVLAVDDFFNPMYPQITEALYLYLDRNPYDFRLFMVGFNKAYLTRPAAFYDYHQFCLDFVPQGMQARDAAVTLAKSTHTADANIFSMIDYTPGHGRQRGPDWDQDHMQVVCKRPAG